jgi:hypothetical protein
MNYNKNMRAYPMYYNPNGPGQYYNLPTKMGEKTMGNKFNNSPAYKFSSVIDNSSNNRSKSIDNIADKQMSVTIEPKKQDFLYPNVDSVKQKSAITLFGKDFKREAFPPKFETLNAPITYLNNTTCITNKNVTSLINLFSSLSRLN